MQKERAYYSQKGLNERSVRTKTQAFLRDLKANNPHASIMSDAQDLERDISEIYGVKQRVVNDVIDSLFVADVGDGHILKARDFKTSLASYGFGISTNVKDANHDMDLLVDAYYSSLMETDVGHSKNYTRELHECRKENLMKDLMASMQGVLRVVTFFSPRTEFLESVKGYLSTVQCAIGVRGLWSKVSSVFTGWSEYMAASPVYVFHHGIWEAWDNQSGEAPTQDESPANLTTILFGATGDVPFSAGGVDDKQEGGDGGSDVPPAPPAVAEPAVAEKVPVIHVAEPVVVEKVLEDPVVRPRKTKKWTPLVMVILISCIFVVTAFHKQILGLQDSVAQTPPGPVAPASAL